LIEWYALNNLRHADIAICVDAWFYRAHTYKNTSSVPCATRYCRSTHCPFLRHWINQYEQNASQNRARCA
jgi:hypothetical protein